MRINFYRLISVCFLVFYYCISNAFSAQITENSNTLTTVKGCTLKLEGPIIEGDAERVKAAIERSVNIIKSSQSSGNPPDAEYYKTFVVCLSGPGGNYLEGIKLAELFANFDITTVVPDYASCESACAIAFLGGSACCDKNGKSVPQRYVYPGSKLVFHAPSLNLRKGEYPKQLAIAAYDLGLDAVLQLRQKSEKLNINEAFLSEIFSHRGNDFYKIATLEIAELNDIFLTGYKSRGLRLDTTVAACSNAINWDFGLEGLRERQQKFNIPLPIGEQYWAGKFKNTNKPTKKLFVRNKIGVFYTWFPYNEDEITCRVRIFKNKNRTLVRVRYNLDIPQDGDPNRWNLIFRPTVLMRGNRSLESTR